MIAFIKITNVGGNSAFYLNAAHILTIEDSSFGHSRIECIGDKRYECEETATDIRKLIRSAIGEYARTINIK